MKKEVVRRISILLFLLAIYAAGGYAERSDIHAEADRPGAGTGTNVLGRGLIQLETGFEAGHILGTHVLTLPTTLFRFGLSPWAELRLEGGGMMVVDDHPYGDSIADYVYGPEPLYVGTKIKLWGGSEEANLRWIPRTSLMLNLGLPMSRSMAEMRPISGKIDLLFENDVADWLTIGYDAGVYWQDYAPTPDVFLSLGFNFAPTDKLGMFIEFYDLLDPDAFWLDDNYGMHTYTLCDLGTDFGLTYMAHPRVQLDIYAGFNLYHSEADVRFPQNNVFVGFGVTWLIARINEKTR